MSNAQSTPSSEANHRIIAVLLSACTFAVVRVLLSIAGVVRPVVARPVRPSVVRRARFSVVHPVRPSAVRPVKPWVVRRSMCTVVFSAVAVDASVCTQNQAFINRRMSQSNYAGLDCDMRRLMLITSPAFTAISGTHG
jgi:hypothetical protein